MFGGAGERICNGRGAPIRTYETCRKSYWSHDKTGAMLYQPLDPRP